MGVPRVVVQSWNATSVLRFVWRKFAEKRTTP
jgi:hypothetical protein